MGKVGVELLADGGTEIVWGALVHTSITSNPKTGHLNFIHPKTFKLPLLALFQEFAIKSPA